MALRMVAVGGCGGATIGGEGGGGLGGGAPIAGVPIDPGDEDGVLAGVIGGGAGADPPPLNARFFIARKDSWHPCEHQNERRPEVRRRSS